MLGILFAALVGGHFLVCEGASKLDYYNLYQYMFSLYNPEVRPVENDANPVTVDVQFHLISINDLNEREQTLVTFGYVGLFWNDDFLSWRPENFSGITELVVPQARIWKPDIVIGNSVERQTQLGYDRRLLRLLSSGNIEWYSTELFYSSCDIGVAYYPFDTQNCIIQLETSTYTSDEINLNLRVNTVDLNEYGENGQWELVSTSIKKGKSSYKDIVNIHLEMKRRRTFYILNVILPIIILSCLASLVFVLPADSGEKMSLAITILLAYIVFLTLISENMPQTSLQISILSVYVTILVAMSCSSVIFSTIVLRFYHKDTVLPVPRLGVSFVKIMTCTRRSANKTAVSPNGGIQKINEVQSLEACDTSNVTWKDVSTAVDFMFFIISIVVTFISSVVCLIILISG